MSSAEWFTLAVVVAMIALLARDVVPPFAAIAGAVIVLMLGNVVTFEQAFQGFSSSAAITVASFYVLAAAVEKTGALRRPLGRILDDGTVLRRSLARLTAPVAVASAFVNNTPIVAMLVEPVRSWSRRTGNPASKALIPLSYASILGGTLTLVGTSTNLVVSNLATDAGQSAPGMFSFAQIGGPVAVVGLVLAVALAPRLLPARGDPDDGDASGRREFLVAMRVRPDRAVDGASVTDAHLDHLHIVRIQRDGESLTDTDDDFVLRGDDIVSFRALPADAVHLQQKPGMANVAVEQIRSVSSTRARYFEAVLGKTSPLVRSHLEEFEERYDTAVVAVRRAGEDVDRTADPVLKAGDTLLLIAGRRFETRWRNHTDFVLVAEIGGPPPTATRQGPLALLILAAVVVLAATGVLPIVQSALAGVMALILLRVLTPNEALRSVDFGVVFVIAAAFGLGAAVQESGLAQSISSAVVGLLSPFPDAVAVLGILALTMFLTELVSNTAAAILAFPIAMAAATKVGVDVEIMAIAVAVCASCSFITPVGYQTNTMVYGPGNYRFADYARLGVPLAASTLAITTAMVLVLGG